MVKNKGETLLQLGEASWLYEVGSHKPTALQFQHLRCFTQHNFLAWNWFNKFNWFSKRKMSDKTQNHCVYSTCLKNSRWEIWNQCGISLLVDCWSFDGYVVAGCLQRQLVKRGPEDIFSRRANDRLHWSTKSTCVEFRVLWRCCGAIWVAASYSFGFSRHRLMPVLKSTNTIVPAPHLGRCTVFTPQWHSGIKWVLECN